MQRINWVKNKKNKKDTKINGGEAMLLPFNFFFSICEEELNNIHTDTHTQSERERDKP